MPKPLRHRQQPQPEPKRRRISARIAPKLSPTKSEHPVEPPARARQLDTQGKLAALQATPDTRSRLAAGRASDSSSLHAPVTQDAPPSAAAPSRSSNPSLQPSGSLKVASRNTHKQSSDGKTAVDVKPTEVPKAAEDEWGPLTAKLTAALEYFIDNRSSSSFQQWHQ